MVASGVDFAVAIMTGEVGLAKPECSEMNDSPPMVSPSQEMGGAMSKPRPMSCRAGGGLGTDPSTPVTVPCDAISAAKSGWYLTKCCMVPTDSRLWLSDDFSPEAVLIVRWNMAPKEADGGRCLMGRSRPSRRSPSSSIRFQGSR